MKWFKEMSGPLRLVVVVLLAWVGLVVMVSLSGCEREADVASRNASKAADNFEIARRIVFYNGITGEYMMTVEGLCSLGNKDKHRELTVTCKYGSGQYKKHFLGLSDNVSFFVEQLDVANVSGFHHRIIWRPQTIIPNVDLEVDVGG